MGGDCRGLVIGKEVWGGLWGVSHWEGRWGDCRGLVIGKGGGGDCR